MIDLRMRNIVCGDFNYHTQSHKSSGFVYSICSINPCLTKSTDNPVNEALNSWIKEKLFVDFRIDNCRTRDEVKETLEKYVKYFNEQ